VRTLAAIAEELTAHFLSRVECAGLSVALLPSAHAAPVFFAVGRSTLDGSSPMRARRSKSDL
jgi:hypothetical protein